MPQKRPRQKPKRRPATRKPRATRSATRSKVSKAVEQKAFQLFDQQIDPLWNRLGHECREFADGFNQEIGMRQLHVEGNLDSLLVKFTASGAEVFLQLDRAQKHLSCWLNSGCTSYGSCITDQPPISFAIVNGQLQFAYSGNIISEEELTVKLLTELVELQ
jgi:hypothetical protein